MTWFCTICLYFTAKVECALFFTCGCHFKLLTVIKIINLSHLISLTWMHILNVLHQIINDLECARLSKANTANKIDWDWIILLLPPLCCTVLKYTPSYFLAVLWLSSWKRIHWLLSLHNVYVTKHEGSRWNHNVAHRKWFRGSKNNLGVNQVWQVRIN